MGAPPIQNERGRLRTGPSRMVNLACYYGVIVPIAVPVNWPKYPVCFVPGGKPSIQIIEEASNWRKIVSDGACRSREEPGTAVDRVRGAPAKRTGGVAKADAASEGITPDLVVIEVVGVHKFSKHQWKRFARRLVRRGTCWSGYW